MTGPALYQYFPNKLAIVDALFVDGFTQLNDALDELNRVGDADESFRLGCAYLSTSASSSRSDFSSFSSGRSHNSPRVIGRWRSQSGLSAS